jgi:predicted Zn-dependent protease
MRLLFLLAALLAGCAAAPPETPPPQPSAPVETAPPATLGIPAAPPSRAGNPAVERLIASAKADQAASRLGSAEATIERALRIAPHDARLWQQLASIRLQQGQYRQAESLAARSNSWAGGDKALRSENWSLIAQARDALGDSEGARAARQNAERYGR